LTQQLSWGYVEVLYAIGTDGGQGDSNNDAGRALQLAATKKPDRPVGTNPAFLMLPILVGGAEFESATPWMSTKYSNQLN
jgi:hypothetical protein